MSEIEGEKRKRKRIVFVFGKQGGFQACKKVLNYVDGDKSLHAFVLLYNVCNNDISRCYVGSDTIEDLNKIHRDGKIDLIVVYGDRSEALYAATWALNNNVSCMHLQAGDKSGNIDDMQRNAISLVSTHHGCTGEDQLDRLSKLFQLTGKNVFCLNVLGDHHAEMMKNTKSRKPNNFPFSDIKFVIVFLHPETNTGNDLKVNKNNVERTLNLLREDYPDCMSYVLKPCNDYGYEIIIEEFEKAGLTIREWLPIEQYKWLLEHAEGWIGNSSSLINELFLFPSLIYHEIGNRQVSRDKVSSVKESSRLTYRWIKEIIK